MIEHLHQMEFLIGIHQGLSVNGTLPSLQTHNGVLQLIFVIRIEEIAVGCPLTVDAQHLLYLTAFHTDQLLLFPR